MMQAVLTPEQEMALQTLIPCPDTRTRLQQLAAELIGIVAELQELTGMFSLDYYAPGKYRVQLGTEDLLRLDPAAKLAAHSGAFNQRVVEIEGVEFFALEAEK